MPSDVPVVCVTADDLKRVPSPSPAFLRWAWEFYAGDRLDFVVQAVIRSGRVATVADALGYLNEIAASKNGDLAVTVEDMRPKKPGGYLYGSVRRIVTERPSNGLDPWLRHGMISHQAIGDLFAGRLTGQAPRIPDEPSGRQLGLFDRATQAELERACRATPRTSVRRTMQTITNRWERLRVGLAENWDRWRCNIRAIQLMHGSLERLYGRYVDRMMRTGLDPRGDLAVLTLMTWASAIARYRRQRHPLCFVTEIPVISSSHRFGGGRVDAIGVSHINGRPLTARHRRILAAMAARPDHFTSTGHVVRELHRYFGKHLGMYVIDFKFLVGDILRWNGILNGVPQLPNVQDGPMPKHEDQMRRYLTLIPFDHNLHGDDPPAQWQSDRFTLRGELWYFLPTAEPVIHQFSMTPDECRDYFQNEILGRWPSYKERADIRTTSNRVLGHVLKLFDDPAGAASGADARMGRRANRTIYPDAGAKPTAFQIIEKLRRANRRFADEFRIIEVIGRRNGAPVYLMDFARLREAIEHGAVRIGHFTAANGGKVGCPLPEQSDSTPSMHIYLAGTPHFHCYGCGASGRIDPGTIPDGVAAAALVERPSRSPARLNGLPVIPDEHHRIMALAQELLAKSYNVAGEPKRYLAKERGLHGAVAAALGAGYGNDETFINGLMDNGYDLDQLIHYGFVGVSANITSPHGIVRILERRGLTLNAIRRPVPSSNGDASMGLPYAVLSRRLTFPLTLEGRHTNFYGRAVVPVKKPFVHRKLSTQHTGVPQGAFNMDTLTADVPEVIVTEGVLDALSLVCMGHPCSVAIIGVGNTAVIQAVARAGKNVAIALDNDKAGREATPKVTQLLRRAGLTANIRDFTTEFVAVHPGTYKDFNEWWQTHQRAE